MSSLYKNHLLIVISNGSHDVICHRKDILYNFTPPFRPLCHSERSASEVELRSSARVHPEAESKGRHRKNTFEYKEVDPDATASPYGFDCVLRTPLRMTTKNDFSPKILPLQQPHTTSSQIINQKRFYKKNIKNYRFYHQISCNKHIISGKIICK